MLQIRVHGRGGQGAQMAAQLLATAFFREGKYVQSFATYGGARRGAPVSAFLRVAEKPIFERCDIDEPDAILCFDPSLLNESLLKGATEKTLVLVNSSQKSEVFRKPGFFNVMTIDGQDIARKNGLGRIVNSTLIGALAALLEAPEINNLKKVVEEMSPAKVEENANSCLEGYELAILKKGAA